MKIQYASDLHLEFPKNKEFIKVNPIEPMGDMLLLAGDIMPFSQLERHGGFLDGLAENFKTTYWIPGNHEYYGGDMSSRSGSFEEKVRENVILLNNRSINRKGYRLIFSTLWSQISVQNEFKVLHGLNDFNHVKVDSKPLTVSGYNAEHHQALDFLNEELKKEVSETTIVVTHHVPTLQHYPQQYKNDPLNEAFATELYDLITETRPDYWIYGHHHNNTANFTIGKTQMLTNQLGYVAYGEHARFQHQKTI